MKTAKKLPKSETLWVTYTSENGTKYYITSNKIRDKYTLWLQGDDHVSQITTSKTPVKFQQILDKREK